MWQYCHEKNMVLKTTNQMYIMNKNNEYVYNEYKDVYNEVCVCACAHMYAHTHTSEWNCT